MTEGGSTYTVRLSHVPTGNVLVEVDSDAAGVVTVSRTGFRDLRFTPAM